MAAAEGLLQPHQPGVGVDQDGVEVAVEQGHRPGLVLFRGALFHQDVAQAAGHAAARQAAAGQVREQGVDLRPEGLAAEGVELKKEKVRRFGGKQPPQALAAGQPHRVKVRAGLRAQRLEIPVHLQRRQAHFTDMAGQRRADAGPARHQDHLVAAERPADLQAAEEMPDPEHVLAVEDDLHV